jgi:hypothetical protein
MLMKTRAYIPRSILATLFLIAVLLLNSFASSGNGGTARASFTSEKESIGSLSWSAPVSEPAAHASAPADQDHASDRVLAMEDNGGPDDVMTVPAETIFATACAGSSELSQPIPATRSHPCALELRPPIV